VTMIGALFQILRPALLVEKARKISLIRRDNPTSQFRPGDFFHDGARSETYERGGYFWTDFGLVLYL